MPKLKTHLIISTYWGEHVRVCGTDFPWYRQPPQSDVLAAGRDSPCRVTCKLCRKNKAFQKFIEARKQRRTKAQRKAPATAALAARRRKKTP